MVEHNVWTAGTNTKVITIFDRISEIYDIDVQDRIKIDWDRAMREGIIEVIRK